MAGISFSRPSFYKLLSVDLISFSLKRFFFFFFLALNASQKSSFLCIGFSSFILFTNYCDIESLYPLAFQNNISYAYLYIHQSMQLHKYINLKY